MIPSGEESYKIPVTSFVKHELNQLSGLEGTKRDDAIKHIRIHIQSMWGKDALTYADKNLFENRTVVVHFAERPMTAESSKETEKKDERSRVDDFAIRKPVISDKNPKTIEAKREWGHATDLPQGHERIARLMAQSLPNTIKDLQAKRQQLIKTSGGTDVSTQLLVIDDNIKEYERQLNFPQVREQTRQIEMEKPKGWFPGWLG